MSMTPVPQPTTVPIFDPDGNVKAIPSHIANDAFASGGKMAVPMNNPSGTLHYVPHDQVDAATKAGGTLHNYLYDTGTTIDARPSGIDSRLEDLSSDVRHGTGATLPGRLLQRMGARGTEAGATPSASDYLAWPILGPIRTEQGIPKVPQHPWQGTKDIAGGLMQTATIPGAFVAPEAAEGTAAVRGRLVHRLPTSHIGGLLGQLKAAIPNDPVNISKAGDVALRVHELDQAGCTMPQIMSWFLRRTTAPDAPPLTFSEARDFYNKSGKLTSIESQRLDKEVTYLFGEFHARLGEPIQETANQGGQGENYSATMKQFPLAANARHMREGADKAIAKDMGTTALYYGTYRGLKSATGGDR